MNNLILPDQRITPARFPFPYEVPLWFPGPALDKFSPISLKELGAASLMDRQETKFIFKADQINHLLMGLETQYQVLEIQGLQVCRYRTVYFDTNDYLFFKQHHTGAGQRWKIRKRTYLDTNLTFLEVKYKDNRKKTLKTRIQTEGNPDQTSSPDHIIFTANLPCPPGDLHVCLETRYTRTTLVYKNSRERITLDSGLSFSDGKKYLDLPGLMIAEIKQNVYSAQSPFMDRLKSNGIRQIQFSKYCIGMVLINPTIKHNRFKPTLHKLKNILEGDYDERPR
ncbi:MAG: polyphosphate polymerase domain-containing protein [Chloroflexi bacterium]|nr:polyphosphate polymerase domain-containing protein [Chloroflexota bacterium]